MEITVCPSCTGPIQPLKGGKFFCEACDCIFRITREGPQVEKVGALEQLANRVGRIEDQIGDPEPPLKDPKPAPGEGTDGPVEDPEEGDPDEKDDDGSELWPQ